MSIIENASRLARFLYKEEALDFGSGCRAGDLQNDLGMTKDEFERAEGYLIRHGYVKRSGFGPDGRLYLTPIGEDYARNP